MTASTTNEGERGPAPEPARVLSPIPGRRIDPEAKPKPKAIRSLEAKTPWVSVVWRAFERFRVARSPLMAGGTAYYAFLAMFSLLAFAYGVAAIVSADAISEWLTDALEEALPGLVGDEGIDPDALARVGQASSVIGLLLLLWSGSAVMIAASDSLHHIYGAPPDGRNMLARRAHLFAWLALLGPLVVLSYTLSTAVSGYASSLLDALGVDGTGARAALLVVGTFVAFLLDVAIMWLLLGWLGGIRADAVALRVGAVVGALAVGVLKSMMALIISWSVDKPQYGSFAIPIAVLVVLWMQSMSLYGSACLTAGTAEVRAAPASDEPSDRSAD